MDDRAQVLDGLIEVDRLFHVFIDDLRDDEWDVRTEPDANTIAFDAWHVGRCRDWTLNTLVLCRPEMVSRPEWTCVASPFLSTDGFAFTREQADVQGRLTTRADVVRYADAGHRALLDWITSAGDDALDRPVVLEDHLRTAWPADKIAELKSFAPGLFGGPMLPLSVIDDIAVGHNYGHVSELARFKQIVRTAEVE